MNSLLRKARVFVHGEPLATLEELEGHLYRLTYDEGYSGAPISLTLPLSPRVRELDSFPSFFEGLLPEGDMLESLLRLRKLDRGDLFGQLLAVGRDVVGAVPYTYANDETTLTPVLERLALDAPWRAAEAERVAAYTETHHDEAAVALRYLDLLDEAFGWRTALQSRRIAPDPVAPKAKTPSYPRRAPTTRPFAYLPVTRDSTERTVWPDSPATV